jgi:hypothetical protein
MDAAGPRGRDAHAEPSGPFGITASGERGGLLVAGLDETNFVLAFAQGFDQAVDAVAGQSEDNFHFPIDQRFDDHVGSGHCAHGAPFGASEEKARGRS